MNINTPLITPQSVLLQTTDVLNKETLQPNNNVPQSIQKTLDELFPEQEYQQKQLKKAKEILGSLTDNLTDMQLQGAITEIQYLAENWLDCFEREIFDGLTLKELLHEKGGA